MLRTNFIRTVKIPMKMIFLVDGDNNIGTGLKGVDMLSDQDTVLIFYQKGYSGPFIKEVPHLIA